ncbi:unnamed protein product, partial [marine sediment metagenome]
PDLKSEIVVFGLTPKPPLIFEQFNTNCIVLDEFDKEYPNKSSVDIA